MNSNLELKSISAFKRSGDFNSPNTPLVSADKSKKISRSDFESRSENENKNPNNNYSGKNQYNSNSDIVEMVDISNKSDNNDNNDKEVRKDKYSNNQKNKDEKYGELGKNLNFDYLDSEMNLLNASIKKKGSKLDRKNVKLEEEINFNDVNENNDNKINID